MSRVAIRGGFVDVELVGHGTPCLIAHGGPGLHHGLYASLDRLAMGRQLVHWDHRGHGRSSPLPVGEVEMDLFASDGIAVADALGLDRFAVFGHSFGGWVAQEMALRRPDRVAALVLAATTPGQLGQGEVDDQGPQMPAEVADLLDQRPSDTAEMIDIYTRLAPHFLRDQDPGLLVGALHPDLVSVEGWNRVMSALSRWSAVDRLQQIDCPTLVLSGRYDIFCSPPQLERIASRVPGAELVMFEQSGHFMWLAEPERFFGTVDRWLGAHYA